MCFRDRGEKKARVAMKGFLANLLEAKTKEALLNSRTFRRVVGHFQRKGAIHGAKAVKEDFHSSESVSKARLFRQLFFDELKSDLGLKEKEMEKHKALGPSVRKKQ